MKIAGGWHRSNKKIDESFSRSLSWTNIHFGRRPRSRQDEKI